MIPSHDKSPVMFDKALFGLVPPRIFTLPEDDSFLQVDGHIFPSLLLAACSSQLSTCQYYVQDNHNKLMHEMDSSLGLKLCQSQFFTCFEFYKNQ